LVLVCGLATKFEDRSMQVPMFQALRAFGCVSCCWRKGAPMKELRAKSIIGVTQSIEGMYGRKRA
jgi:hypothetical protein